MTRRDRDREARIVAAYRSGKSLRAVGAEFGLSGERVSQLLAQAGVATRPRGFACRRFDRDEAARLYRSGLSLLEVAARLGVTVTPVHKALRDMGLPLRPRGRKQANHQLLTTPAHREGVAANPHQRRDVGRSITH